MIDQAGVDLHQRRPHLEAAFCIFGAHDLTHADNGDSSIVIACCQLNGILDPQDSVDGLKPTGPHQLQGQVVGNFGIKLEEKRAE